MIATVRSVVAAECCNYLARGPGDVVHWCVAKERTCPVFALFRRCRWFEEAVLPAWPDVAAEYADLAGRLKTSESRAARRAVCPICGATFRATGNRQRYCSEECRKEGARASERDKKRRQRSGRVRVPI